MHSSNHQFDSGTALLFFLIFFRGSQFFLPLLRTVFPDFSLRADFVTPILGVKETSQDYLPLST